MSKTIVVALDGSSCAEEALTFAILSAKAQEATLDVCLVIDPETLPVGSLRAALIAPAKNEAGGVIREALQRASANGVLADGCVLVGDPAAEIVARAAKLGAGSIVLGAHGQSGFRRLSFGNVAESILRNAQCAVVTVRQQAAAPIEQVRQPCADQSAPVSVVRLLEVAVADAGNLYADIADFMRSAGSRLPGFVEARVFLSDDSTRIMIVADFETHDAWCRAQWDAAFGAFLARLLIRSETLDFDLYRSSRFSAAAPFHASSAAL